MCFGAPMRPRRLDPVRRCGALTVLSAFVLLVASGKAFAQSNDVSRELPPIQVTGAETLRHKKPPRPRRGNKPADANSRNLAQPTQAPASGGRSVASGAKG